MTGGCCFKFPLAPLYADSETTETSETSGKKRTFDTVFKPVSLTNTFIEITETSETTLEEWAL